MHVGTQLASLHAGSIAWARRQTLALIMASVGAAVRSKSCSSISSRSKVGSPSDAVALKTTPSWFFTPVKNTWCFLLEVVSEAMKPASEHIP